MFSILEYTNIHETTFKIGLVGAGEPLLRFDLINQAIVFARKYDAANRLSFYTISNGVLLTNEMLIFFHKNKDLIALNFSVDGPEYIHDANRRFSDGTGSYQYVMQSIRKYEDLFSCTPIVNAVVHKLTIEHQTDVLDYFEHNLPSVCFSRIFDMNESLLSITNEEFENFMRLASQRNGLKLRQYLISPAKYDCTMYGRLCGVGRTNIFFIGNDIFPCARFVGQSQHRLGSNSDRLDTIEEVMHKRFPPCPDGKCWYDSLVKGVAK